MNKGKLVGVIGFTVIVGTLLGFSAINLINPNPIKNLDDDGPAADFTLPSYDGNNYTLSSDIGKVIALTLLFTRCQMGCSLISSNMASVRNKLVDKGQMDDVKLITIDFDWKYDDMEDLKNYASKYSSNSEQWQFLLGNQNQTDEIVEDYNFYYEEEVNIGNMTAGGVDIGPSYTHMFVVYVIDQKGNFREHVYGSGWEVDQLYFPIDFLLNEGK